jgi:hypothetical protein
LADVVETRLETNRRPRWTIVRDLSVAVVVVVLIWAGLRVLRSETALDALGPFGGKAVQAFIGIVLGVVGIWALFVVANSLVELLPARATTIVRPYVFVGPAIVVVSIFLVAPAVGTIIQSFTEVPEGEGLFYNYVQAFTDPALQIALRNNAIWLILAPAGALPSASPSQLWSTASSGSPWPRLSSSSLFVSRAPGSPSSGDSSTNGDPPVRHR